MYSLVRPLIFKLDPETAHHSTLALLKKGKELILGNGKIETYLGKSYFIKGQPIDDEKVKYKFSETDCKE